jgi:leader peptidase (prepilin peptidase)/N-methyltransferase
MTPDFIPLALIALLGLAVGSFLNVVIWRVPRGENLSSPPSACPRCAHEIRARDNIPVLSWLLLGGKCRDCREPISIRYPLVEAGTAVAFVLAALQIGFTSPEVWSLPAYLYLVAISIALGLIDLDTRRLPNRIVLPSYVVAGVLLAAASVALQDWVPFALALAGSGILFLLYFLLALASRGGMGFGDVKLAGVLGLYLGFSGWGTLAVGAFAAFALGGIFGLILLAVRRAGRKSAIPFGPWMIVGAWIGIAFGANISTSYLSAIGFA